MSKPATRSGCSRAARSSLGRLGAVGRRQHRELVLADPGHQRARREGGGQARAQRRQHQVGALVAQRLVQPAQAIEVGDHQLVAAGWPAAARGRGRRSCGGRAGRSARRCSEAAKLRLAARRRRRRAGPPPARRRARCRRSPPRMRRRAAISAPGLADRAACPRRAARSCGRTRARRAAERAFRARADPGPARATRRSAAGGRARAPTPTARRRPRREPRARSSRPRPACRLTPSSAPIRTRAQRACADQHVLAPALARGGRRHQSEQEMISPDRR